MSKASQSLVTSAATWIRRNVARMIMAKGGSSWANGWLRGDELDGEGAILTNALRQSSWIYACINTIATSVAQVPFRISRGERYGEDILEQGKLVDLFRRPHPQLNRFQFWQLWTTWLMLRGEVFIVPHYAGAGRGRQRRMVILCPDHWQHVIDNNELVGWRYTGFTEAPLASQVFLPEEVIHSRFPNPYNFWRGAGPNHVALLAAQTDYASAQFMKGLMLNNADTGVIAYTDQQPSEEQRVAILAALKERKRKAGTADRPLMLWGGFKIEKPTVSSADMQFLENRKFNRQEICAVFGVPQELLGFTEDANRSVSDAARLNFVENRISPLCEMIEADLEDFVLSYDDDSSEGPQGLYGWFDCDALPVMQKARQSRIDSLVKLFGVGVPVNVGNQILDLGLPDLPHGEKSYLPFNLQEVGAAGKSNTENAEKPEGAEKNPAEKLVSPLLKLLAPPLPALSPKGGEVNHTCGARSEEYAASIAGSVKLKTGKLRKFFFEQRSRVLSKLGEVAKGFTAAGATPLPDPVLSEGRGNSVRAIEDVFNEEFEDSELLAKLKPALIADLEFGGAQLWREIGLEDFSLPPSEAIEFLNVRENVIKEINDVTWSQLKETLQDGLANGETMKQLEARVREVFNDASDARAETIALTETNTAVNSGRFKGMKLAKVEKKGWQASNLENVRASHLRAEQDYEKGIPIDKPFRVGGYDLMHPGDPKGPAHEVINCRCFTFAVINEKAIAPVKFLRWEDFTAQKETKKTK